MHYHIWLIISVVFNLKTSLLIIRPVGSRRFKTDQFCYSSKSEHSKTKSSFACPSCYDHFDDYEDLKSHVHSSHMGERNKEGKRQREDEPELTPLAAKKVSLALKEKTAILTFINYKAGMYSTGGPKLTEKSINEL
ncbi:C2H2-type zinc finger transcription factor [Phycomyces blakesleeanus NRRL 1555(-)]|uniref:C2H2-type zinc finger transcription factor n=1 Tax=Phycomyces blakesleeanus (strain ATCC 8743b / DSM 1359 / FGSC 10004 / NBRC 33097 / NRRL 1555) TaxID=763407 RepID=A0A167LNR5_PHYB8|nr:C2H2-type zinc finger transcription factor [Phycomyces blakesleeanus NRRL 1555(-)]OAD70807.1 C2H2-type zinc finger transcription factor [Phycomyces blakesleeanus NRRL 1555(-)]|eukprot:XP_018288847.1 C2H2-type zinc finger transcription factor [Phycomyces blakesleeanus NRRL 1555(-)]